MAEFTLQQKIGAMNAIKKNCEKAVKELGVPCPVGGVCDAIIKAIEADLRFADKYIEVCSQHES